VTPVAGTGSALRLTVNGDPVELRAPGGRRLLDVLRRDLGLTGTKEGCGEGECGACSVLLDGEVVNSCLVPVAQAAGCAVRTVEGLARDGRLGPLQQAFLEAGAAQCGFCTPGVLLAAEAFLGSGAAATEGAVREAIAGNLCRCTGYTKIVEAVARAARHGRSEEGQRTPAPPRRAAAPEWAGPELVRPISLTDALELLAGGPSLRPVAGGTDLMVALHAGGEARDVPLLDLWGLDELRGIRLDGGDLVLGALTTYAELRRSPLVARTLPVLGVAAATIGAAQVQARGTIGGNVVNASPAGDLLPVLLATDASLVVASTAGGRVVPANGFWRAYRATACAPGELVTEVRIPLPAGRVVRFRKVGTRRALAISKVVLAVAWRRDDGGAWRDVRVAAGSVAEVPLRAPAAEAVLEGQRPSVETAQRAAAAVMRDVRPIDDVRSTAAYRRAVTGRVLRRIVLEEAGTPDRAG
jgi:carbon-monoxide dehydrogenase small subunit/xanthine dehydrogenase small subunit